MFVEFWHNIGNGIYPCQNRYRWRAQKTKALKKIVFSPITYSKKKIIFHKHLDLKDSIHILYYTAVNMPHKPQYCPQCPMLAMPLLSWCFIMGAWVQSQVSACRICGGHSGTRTGLPPSALILLCRYHSTKVTYSTFIHLPSTLFNLRN